jgi:hypothetical protein
MPSVVDLGSGHANYLTLCHIHHKIKLFWALEAPFWGQNHRFKKWTKSIAVEDKSSVNNVKERLGFRFKDRKIIIEENDCRLRDEQTAYVNTAYFNSENSSVFRSFTR